MFTMGDLMECWKNADSFERKVFSIVQELMADQPMLLSFLFDLDFPRLRYPADELLRRAQALSSGERVLVRLSVDIWCEGAQLTVNELFGLDQKNLHKALHAIAKLSS